MTTAYFVSKGASILGYNGVQFKEGLEVVPGKDFPVKALTDLVQTGFLRPIGASAAATSPAGVPPVPSLPVETTDRGRDTDPLPIPTRVDVETEQAAKAVHQEARQIGKTKLDMSGLKDRKPQAPTTQWVLDPTGLAGKSLDELNLMILERQKDGPTFTSAQEAGLFLSQDFQPKIAK